MYYTKLKVGDDYSTFENLPTIIVDLMFATWVYWQCISENSKWIFVTIKSQLKLTNLQIHSSYLHSKSISDNYASSCLKYSRRNCFYMCKLFDGTISVIDACKNLMVSSQKRCYIKTCIKMLNKPDFDYWNK